MLTDKKSDKDAPELFSASPYDEQNLPNTATRVVLVIDDSAINRRLLCKILAGTYEILEACNGREGLDVLERAGERIALVLLDLVMPVMDGYEFLRLYKQNPAIAHIPVIVTTQKDGESEEVLALKSGATDFLTKPYRPQIILHRVANIISFRETAAIANMAQRDPLTGLLSRAFFYQKAEDLIAAHPETNYDIICCDIENFKLVNDLFGLSTGDGLLRYMGEIIRQKLEGFGIFGRLEADVFAVILPRQASYKPASFIEANQRLQQYPIGIRVTAKYGIYAVEADRPSVSIMCDRARLAIRSIKGKYGVFFAYYDEGMRRSLLNEQFMLDNMKQALAERQFHVYLQPKCTVSTRKIAGAEALVRWIHPERGLMAPGEFIPLFEKNGFIIQLDEFVWDETCRLIREWLDAGKPIVPISVNVSRADIYHPELSHRLIETVYRHGLSPAHLHLEITETAYTENPRQLIEVVSGLKAMGFVIEMDDFGTGYSSLNMLSELPIDILKLDIRFIQNATLAGKKNILSFMISLAKWLDLLVVAEGVENEEQLDMLRAMDCNMAQGYYYSKPIPEEQFSEMLTPLNIALLPEGMPHQPAAASVHEACGERVMLLANSVELDRRVLSMVFRDVFQIVEAGNGAEALRYLRAHPRKVDMVLLDIMLPDMDGYQVMAHLQSDRLLRRIPVVIMGQTSGEDEARALAMGAADYIARPFCAQVALRRVDNALASAGARERVAELVMRQEVTKPAYRDPLTGFLNQSGLDMAVSRLADTRTLRAVFRINLDHFAQANAALGYAAGDEALRQVAQTLTTLFRANDLIARTKGDEFTVVASHVPSDSFAVKRGVLICREIESLELGFTASVGVVTFRDDAQPYKSLFAAANAALLRAKASGMNRCCLWTAASTPPHPEIYELPADCSHVNLS